MVASMLGKEAAQQGERSVGKDRSVLGLAHLDLGLSRQGRNTFPTRLRQKDGERM
jgi:hypothetical protein